MQLVTTGGETQAVAAPQWTELSGGGDRDWTEGRKKEQKEGERDEEMVWEVKELNEIKREGQW